MKKTKTVKALSVHQPWANLIALGKKTVEIRSWTTPHRGRLYICSSKTPNFHDLLCGHLVGSVDLVDIRPMKATDVALSGGVKYSPNLYAWVLKKPKFRCAEYPVSGKQRIFDLEILENKGKKYPKEDKNGS